MKLEDTDAHFAGAVNLKKFSATDTPDLSKNKQFNL